MRKLKLIALLLFVMILSITMVGCGNKDNGKAPDPGGEFSYDRIPVLLTDAATIVDKEWVPADFPGFTFSKIDNGFYVGDEYIKYDGGYLIFHLSEPSRDNVLRAIYYLNTRPEIKSATVDSIETGD